MLSGCKPTKYVPADKYLLKTVTIQVDKKGIKKEDLKSYIRQKPNKVIFGFIRFHLGLYNLSNIKKENGLNKYLRNIGEEPVIWDPKLTDRSVKQLKLYLNKKGYYNAIVLDTVLKHKKYLNVQYNVFINNPYRISNLKYIFEDTVAKQLILSDSIHSLVKLNGTFDEEMLQNDRIRIETLLKNNGYYHFNRNYIVFTGDTFSLKVDLNMIVKKSQTKQDSTTFGSKTYKKYKINRVVISTEPDPLNRVSLNKQKKDTILKNGIEFIYQENFWVRPVVIQQANYLVPHSIFNYSDGEETKRHLSSLNTFSLININYTELPPSDSSDFGYLNCFVKLTPLSIQSYSVTTEGTNSGGNLGGALNFTYQHKSILGNAENLSLKFTGATEYIKNKENGLHNTLELGIESTITVPKFLMPFNNNNFIKKYNPKTSFVSAYNYQRRPDFTISIFNSSFGYYWKQNNRITHIAKPLDINFVNLINATSNFIDSIKNTYLENSYANHFVSDFSYSFIYSNQNLNKNKDFHYLKWNFETAGNMMRIYNKITNAPMAYGVKGDGTMDSNGYFTLFGIRFSQYVKTYIDYHYYRILNSDNTIVYRLFGGIGIPYGNAQVMPYEKQYFSGGANSIRGWEVRTLGPGSYKGTISKYPNSTGDIKLEGNIEYRFKLFWILEGALFTDAGNVWTINNADSRKDALFRTDKFYKDIAIGSGIGIRFLLGYFTGRIDFGIKMRNPAEPANNRWLFFEKRFEYKNDKAFSFAIAYPF